MDKKHNSIVALERERVVHLGERGGSPILFLRSYKSYYLGITLYLVEVYIKEFLLGFLPHEVFLGQISVFFYVVVLVFISLIHLYMVMML